MIFVRYVPGSRIAGPEAMHILNISRYYEFPRVILTTDIPVSGSEQYSCRRMAFLTGKCHRLECISGKKLELQCYIDLHLGLQSHD